MAKELPYFKFEPAEYLTKDISFCSLSAQGLFINICSYYWQRGCELTKEQLLRRLNHEKEFNELISEGVIDLVNNEIKIKFLDSQLIEVEEKSKVNSANGSKGGRPKKNPSESENKPNENPTESESKGIREDKRREENIKKNNTATPDKFSFFNSLINQGATKELANDWLKVRKNKKLTNSKPALESFINEVEKSGRDINEVLKQCVIRSWGGFKSSWAFEEETPKNTTGRTTQKLMKYDD